MVNPRETITNGYVRVFWLAVNLFIENLSVEQLLFSGRSAFSAVVFLTLLLRRRVRRSRTCTNAPFIINIFSVGLSLHLTRECLRLVVHDAHSKHYVLFHRLSQLRCSLQKLRSIDRFIRWEVIHSSGLTRWHWLFAFLSFHPSCIERSRICTTMRLQAKLAVGPMRTDQIGFLNKSICSYFPFPSFVYSIESRRAMGLFAMMHCRWHLTWMLVFLFFRCLPREIHHCSSHTFICKDTRKKHILFLCL